MLLQCDLGLRIKGANLLGKWGQTSPKGRGQIGFPIQLQPSQNLENSMGMDICHQGI